MIFIRVHSGSNDHRAQGAGLGSDFFAGTPWFQLAIRMQAVMGNICADMAWRQMIIALNPQFKYTPLLSKKIPRPEMGRDD